MTAMSDVICNVLPETNVIILKIYILAENVATDWRLLLNIYAKIHYRIVFEEICQSNRRKYVKMTQNSDHNMGPYAAIINRRAICNWLMWQRARECKDN
jgi:hypothetical protein